MPRGLAETGLIVAFLLTFPTIGGSQDRSTTFHDRTKLSVAEAEQIDKAVRELMGRDDAVGVAVGVIRRGQTAYVKGYGLADKETKQPITRATMFRWASVSKPLTAVAAMQLVEQKQLDLKADVRNYVPEFPASEHTITARDLLCHQGGIVHYTNGRVVPTRRDYDVEHPFVDVVVALDRFNKSPLLFPPGQKYSYTTHGYILLSAVVQRAGKQPFHEQVAERIAGPAGMTTLRPDYEWEAIPNRATGYRKLFGRITTSAAGDVSWKLGGGGYISNIGDMTRFAQALMNGKLVSAKTESTMWTPQSTGDGKTTGYALGFGISGSGRDRTVGHSGSQPKTRTLMTMYPDRDIGICLATNSEWVRLADYRARIMPIVRQTSNE